MKHINLHNVAIVFAMFWIGLFGCRAVYQMLNNGAPRLVPSVREMIETPQSDTEAEAWDRQWSDAYDLVDQYIHATSKIA